MPLFRKKHSQSSQASASPRVKKPSLILEDLVGSQETRITSEEQRTSIFSYLGLNTLYSETPLIRTLTSPSTQCHFVDYCKQRGGNNLVRFWLDVYSLRGSSGSVVGAKSYPTGATSPVLDCGQEASSSSSSRSLDSGLELHEDDTTTNEVNNDQQNNQPWVKRDAVEIYHKFFAPDSALSLTDFVDSNMTRRVVESICTVSGQVDPSCFDEAHKHVEQSLEKHFFQPYLGSACYALQQIELCNSESLSLGTLLGDETLSMHLAEHAEASGFTHLLEFIVAAVHFRHQASVQGSISTERTTCESVRGDALVLYDKYVSLASPSRLGLSDNLRSAIERGLEDKRVAMNVFDDAIATAGKIVQQHFLPAFLASSHLKQYIIEMNTVIRTDKSNQTVLKGKEAYQNNSPCSNDNQGNPISDISISNDQAISNSDVSTHNTLLASASKSKVNMTRSASNSILLSPWDHPDALWRRTHHSLINIGRIDCYGRYRSTLEPLPSSSGQNNKRIGNKMAKVVKKLVSNGDEFDQVQKEMAWQVAQSILKDVENDLRMSIT